MRRRGTLVKAITFEQSDVVEHWAPLAASLPGLPNLEEFSFDAWGATFLEDWNYTEGEPALGDPNLDRYEEVRYAIFDLLQRVKKLVARGDILDDIFAMFARAVPNGASFATEHLLLTGEVVEDFRYFDAISNLMPNLRHLELRVDRVYQQLDADFEPFRRSFADLRHLTMDVCSGAASPQLFHLAQVIGANLETLRLRDRSRCTSAGRALPPFASVFPRLRLLELNPLQPPSPADGQVLLRSITSERFPVLETLVVDPNRAFGTAGKPTIVGRPDVSIIAPPEVVGKRPLRLLSYERRRAATAEAMRKRSSHMTDDDVRFALVASAAADAHLFAQNGSLRYELQDVVRFLSNRFRAAVRQDDRVALARLAEAARPLALEQRFMEAKSGRVKVQLDPAFQTRCALLADFFCIRILRSRSLNVRLLRGKCWDGTAALLS